MLRWGWIRSDSRRRVYDDPVNATNHKAASKTREELEQRGILLENGLAKATMRRWSFIMDIKRKTELSYPGEQFTQYDNTRLVAEAMVWLGANVLFVNVNYQVGHTHGAEGKQQCHCGHEGRCCGQDSSGAGEGGQG